MCLSLCAGLYIIIFVSGKRLGRGPPKFAHFNCRRHKPTTTHEELKCILRGHVLIFSRFLRLQFHLTFQIKFFCHCDRLAPGKCREVGILFQIR